MLGEDAKERLEAGVQDRNLWVKSKNENQFEPQRRKGRKAPLTFILSPQRGERRLI